MSAPSSNISVVIPCRGHARLLPECIQSVLGQSLKPSEVIVVSDGSAETAAAAALFPAHVRTVPHSSGDPVSARLRGLLEAEGDYVCFLDADDYLAPDYLQQGVERFHQEYRIAVVYSDLEQVGLVHGRIALPAEVSRLQLDETGAVPAGGMVRRSVALLTGAFHPPYPSECSESWLAWRRILDAGYRAVRQSSRYYYRRHEGAAAVRKNNDGQPSYFDTRALASERVAIGIVLSGESECWAAQRDFLLRQTWPREQTALLIVYTGTDPEISRRLREELFSSGYTDITIVDLPWETSDSAASLLGEHAALEALSARLDACYVLLLNERIVPPDKIIERLFRGISAEIVSVAADHAAPSGMSAALLLDDHGRPSSSSLREVTANAFGCVLLRSSALKEAFAVCSPDKGDSAPHLACSPETRFYGSRSSGERCVVDSSIHCTLLGSPENLVAAEPEEGNRFDDQFYYSTNPDVKEAVLAGKLSSAYEHWLRWGKNEGRLARFY